ncbi:MULTISPECIES: IS66 family insertion sequence element accessory protein TnpB [Shewanella]|uniref:Uncharacterized protein n=1 Tax=Shewanella psychromarinicola TaxID=2487742 RepID=A0A3N4EP94_9GAMM|nr:hypothetical protein EGC80_11310 [Shewanella psychromarinicola]RPA31174.1 hypothetical protein EGC77_14555 [Shewanella psychromarinicola]
MTPTGNVYLVSSVTDMRKSIDGLSLIVSDRVAMTTSSTFLFRRYLKALRTDMLALLLRVK